MCVRLHLWLVTCVLVAAPAAHSAQPRHTNWPKLSSPLSGASWTIADFNGDGLPDLVTSSPDGYSVSGYGHRLELHLSADTGAPSSFQIFGANASLSLIAQDVDGDHDIDLVIVSAISHQPVGVWINDGAGVFTQGDASVYAATVWSTFDTAFASPPNPSSLPLLLAQDQRASSALLPIAVFLSRPGANRALARPTHHRPCLFAAGRLSSRAPPIA